MESKHDEPCNAFFDIGSFRFECAGHLPGVVDRAIKYHRGRIEHCSSSPEEVGDVNVTFWTEVERCPSHCIDGWVILNPNWPNGDLPYRERCEECDGSGFINGDA